jgi:hypothetical protein
VGADYIGLFTILKPACPVAAFGGNLRAWKTPHGRVAERYNDAGSESSPVDVGRNLHAEG